MAHDDPPRPALTTDSQARKAIPLATGCLDYFPAALAAVAEISRVGNDKHNPGEPLHHARGKSMDHADCILRHLVDRGTRYVERVNGVDVELSHTAALAWRALALLQEECEAAGAPLARGAWAGETVAAVSAPVERRNCVPIYRETRAALAEAADVPAFQDGDTAWQLFYRRKDPDLWVRVDSLLGLSPDQAEEDTRVAFLRVWDGSKADPSPSGRTK